MEMSCLAEVCIRDGRFLKEMITGFVIVIFLGVSLFGGFCFAETQFGQYWVKPRQIIPEGECHSGLYLLEGGKFGVQVFCGGATGTNIILVSLEAEAPDPWENWERYWQSESWGSDMKDFFATSKANKIVIATSEVYGSGSVLLVDIAKKQTEDLLKEFYVQLKKENIPCPCSAEISFVENNGNFSVLLYCLDEQYNINFSEEGRVLHVRKGKVIH